MVEINSVQNKLFLFIMDNGKGFNVNSKKCGIGLMNIQTRAENLNGKIELKTKPGEGCRLEIEIPFYGKEVQPDVKLVS